MPPALRYDLWMKTFSIEVQRFQSASNSHGQIRARVDAIVQPNTARTDAAGEPASSLVMTVENARVLMLLLKAQLTEIDSKKARSQR